LWIIKDIIDILYHICFIVRYYGFVFLELLCSQMLPLIIVYQTVAPIAFLWPIFDVGIPGMAAGKKKFN